MELNLVYDFGANSECMTSILTLAKDVLGLPLDLHVSR